MPTLVVDPAQYAHAAEGMTSVAHSAHSAVSSLAGELGASSGMAGSDNAGTTWADGYDQGARAALSAAASAVGAVGNIATRLHATGDNHAHADASSVIGGGGDGSLGAAPAPPTMSAPSIPSSAGGSGGGPPGWSMVEGLVGYVWPNGHQDRLHAADAAWKAAAAQLQDAAGPTSAAASAVSAQQSPEAAAAAQACTDAGSHLRELSSVFTELGSSCSEYASHLDQAHHEIIHELEVLLAQTVAIEAVSAIAGFFTAGIGEFAGQAVETARLSAAAAKIRAIIEALIAAARAVAASIGRVAGRAGELLSKLKPMEEGAVKRATSASAHGPKPIDDPAVTPSGLTASKVQEVIDLGKGNRPDPRSYVDPGPYADHEAQFQNGVSRLMKENDLNKYGIARVEDGTSFVMPKADVDALLQSAKGDPRKLEEFMGLPEGQLQNSSIMRVDIDDATQFGVRMPSGNEAGANEMWIPGGYLPGGMPEAVIDAGNVPDALKIVSKVN
ncbi:hypothetical protein [uncultured Williamsia sp.]|uniref:WXG100-like domain-containing protein n=1 Tax=uncultured Williamsia sp. TaxID=259311 RepID=UPI002602587E|nr:hypothetical protein [uncultured Williamsia sp.]